MSEVDRGFTLTRLLGAPRERVFQAWTDPNELGWFFSGLGDPREPIEVDLRVGGAWRQKMVVDQDTEYVTGGIYREIVPPERLVFVWGATDGWPRIDPEHIDDGPIVTVTLNEAGDKTEMVFELRLPDHLPEDKVREWFAMGVRNGWSDTIDRMVDRFAGAVRS